MKIAVNKCYGGFGLSKEAYDYLGIPWDDFGYVYNNEEKRTDPRLIECIETLGARADGRFASLTIVEVPDGAPYEIENYDGIETVIAPKIIYG